MGRHKKIRTKEELEQFEIILKVPEALREPEILKAIGHGLHLVNVGERPKKIPSGKMVSTRIKLNPVGRQDWDKALSRGGFHSKQQLLRTTLALLHELPKYAHKIRTKGGLKNEQDQKP